MVFQGLDQQQAQSVWQPFFDWVAKSHQDFTVTSKPAILSIPARNFWDPEYMRKNHPQFVIADNRPGAPAGNVFWADDGGQVGFFLHGYASQWLPASLLGNDRQRQLADALFASTRYWYVGLHFNKGLAGGTEDAIADAGDTAMNPAVLHAFALAIIAGGEGPAFPGIPGHEPHLAEARENAGKIARSMEQLRKLVPDPGSYVSESDFFEKSWQQSFWGTNYPRLQAVKRKYDPDGLFFVHHGVGSEEWSADGFTRLS
jgi:hypothetical protein